MNEAKAQRLYDEWKERELRNKDKCSRCGWARRFHNRGNRASEDSICRLFKPIDN